MQLRGLKGEKNGGKNAKSAASKHGSNNTNSLDYAVDILYAVIGKIPITRTITQLNVHYFDLPRIETNSVNF